VSPVLNPFPGPQPYRAADRDRFFGRDGMIRKLSAAVLAQRCVTVYGPSGAGKSSLMQAGVIPQLAEAHDVRAVRVDTWPEDRTPAAWLATAMFDALKLGDVPEGTAVEAVIAAVQRAVRRSDAPVLVYLDQIEQVLAPVREPDLDDFAAAVGALADLPIRGLHVVLSLREDYLGRFRDRLRARRRLLDHGFRVGPLTVGELVGAVCLAAAKGEPAQEWSADEMRGLMLQVRTPGQAETDQAEGQAAYAQIVCRALWAERDGEQGPRSRLAELKAEPILQRYLEATLEGLGSDKEEARRLLEDQLITGDGARTLRTERELGEEVRAEVLGKVLRSLEDAAILRAEEHQGSRYFELGHDWLAKKVLERRRVREEEEAKRSEETANAERRKKEEEDARRERARRRLWTFTAAIAAVAALLALLVAWALEQRDSEAHARLSAEVARRDVEEQRDVARTASQMAGARELFMRGHATTAALVLSAVDEPERARGWGAVVTDLLAQGIPRSTRLHKAGVMSVSWSPDGRRFVTGAEDNLVRVWNADGSGDPLVLKGHEGTVWSASWSPGGQRIATGSWDKTARVWNADGSGDPLVLKGHEDSVRSVSWSPDGKRIATGSEDNTARVWTANGSGNPLVLKGHEGAVWSVSWSPDGKRIATGSEDRTARVWDVDEPGNPLVLEADDGAVHSTSWSSDGSRLVTGHEHSTLVWDTLHISSASEFVRVLMLGGWADDRGRVWGASWSPDGNRIVTAFGNGKAHIWNADGSGVPVMLNGHEGQVRSASWSPDGESVVTASADHTARVWSTSSAGVLVVVQGYPRKYIQERWALLRWARSPRPRVKPPQVRMGSTQVSDRDPSAASWSPDGNRVVTGAEESTARIFDADGSSVRLLLRGHAERVNSASWSHDGRRIVTASQDDTARVWNADGSGEPVVLIGHLRPVYSAAWSPDDTRILTSSADDAARVWSVDGSSPPVVLKGHEEEIYSAVWSPDGRRVLTGSRDKTARVWSADGSDEPVVLKGHEGAVFHATWSPDGQRIVTVSRDKTVRVWDAVRFVEVLALKGHGGEVYSAAWSPDGRRIVTGSSDYTARVWNADGSGEPVVLPGHDGFLDSVSWSPDGTRILVRSRSAVRVWQADGSGEPIVLSPRDEEGRVLAASWSPDGTRILAWLRDTTTRVLLVDIPALRQSLREATVDHCLTPEQRRIYLLDTAEDSRHQYSLCERSHDRTPYFDGLVKP
jgi:WD40 repeat protein